MKLAIHYPHPHLYACPTGVGKHMLNMTLGLANRPDCQSGLLTSRHNLTEEHGLPADSPLVRIPVMPLPLPDNSIHRLWKYFGQPSADRWCGESDWVYCPGETYVATTRIPLATSLHAIDFFDDAYVSRYQDTTLRKWARWKFHLHRIFSRARLVLTPSDFLRSKLLELGYGDESSIQSVGNGVEDDYFAVGSTPRPPLTHEYLVTVGGLRSIKGAREVIALSEVLERTAPGVQIVVVGIDHAEWVEAAKTRPNIELRGYVGVDGGLPQLLRGALAALVLSRYETFGIPAVEAMAAGTPVIANRVGALPDTVGDAGLLVNADRADEVAAAVSELRRNSALRDDLIRRGRARAEHFRWDACVDRLVNALKVRGG